ncbi:MAG: hypothetical protein AB1758_33225, partial [Candidatus Eremiobacterota bacterium]
RAQASGSALRPVNPPPRGVTPLMRWLLVEVLKRPRPDLLDQLEVLLDRLDVLESQLPRVPGLEEISACFLEAGAHYRQAAWELALQLNQRVPGRWARAARQARQGAALLEQADALNFRLRARLEPPAPLA